MASEKDDAALADEAAVEEEFDRALAVTLDVDADLLRRLTAEVLTTGEMTFSRNGSTLKATISRRGTVLRVEVNDSWSGAVSLPRPGRHDDYRVEEVHMHLAMGLMNL